MLLLNLSSPVTQRYCNFPSTQERNLGVILFLPFLSTSVSSPSTSVSVYLLNMSLICALLSFSIPRLLVQLPTSFTSNCSLCFPHAFCILQFPNRSQKELLKSKLDLQGLENQASFGLPILNHVTYIFNLKSCSYCFPFHLTSLAPTFTQGFHLAVHAPFISGHQGLQGFLMQPLKSLSLKVHMHNPNISILDLQCSDSFIPPKLWFPLPETPVPLPLCPLC